MCVCTNIYSLSLSLVLNVLQSFNRHLEQSCKKIATLINHIKIKKTKLPYSKLAECWVREVPQRD
jgi:hypothetical protein